MSNSSILNGDLKNWMTFRFWFHNIPLFFYVLHHVLQPIKELWPLRWLKASEDACSLYGMFSVCDCARTECSFYKKKKKPLYLTSSPAGFIYYTVLNTSVQESSSSQLVNFLVEYFQLLNDDLGLCHTILYFVYYIDGTIKKNPSIQSCILIFVTLTISVLSSNILGVFFETYTERNVWTGITKFSSFCFCTQHSNNNKKKNMINPPIWIYSYHNINTFGTGYFLGKGKGFVWFH